MLLASQVMLGVAAGLTTVGVPLYLAEIAHAKSRGAMVCVIELMSALGMLACAALVEGGTQADATHGYAITPYHPLRPSLSRPRRSPQRR